jgi:hypothetical protein
MEIDLPLIVTLAMVLVLLGYPLYKWIMVARKRRHKFGISLERVSNPKHIWQTSIREGVLYCNVGLIF